MDQCDACRSVESHSDPSLTCRWSEMKDKNNTTKGKSQKPVAATS